MGEGTRFPADVRRRIEREYAGETWFEATRLLSALDVETRVLRALLWLASGDYPELERFARCAERDWRDVVFWAEYEDHEGSRPRRVRDLSEPFPPEDTLA